MSEKIGRLLRDEGGNYIFPFFWQHGEDEATLREYMKAIRDSNLKAVCVESRPHPDYCGPKWWEDMDIILDEARKRGMKVWILDDSHFPTGFANGAMADKPARLHRQSIVCTRFSASAGKKLHLKPKQTGHPRPFKKTIVERVVIKGKDPVFDDERLISLYAYRTDKAAAPVDLKPLIDNGDLVWKPAEGTWEICAVHASRNFGPHRQYINMMDETSCRVLIDAVYEPHYAHYAEDFGTTIAGFFSDEPELGNGHLYNYEDAFGTDVDYPWSAELEEAMQLALGARYEELIPLLWVSGTEKDTAAKVRWQYMNAVTMLVKKDFSDQIGSWCRAHGVQYIGHMIEDMDHHSRTGSSLGHYFRGLAGQDMAGIDDIGGQVYPQGEDITYNKGMFQVRDGGFYHYTMGKLAASAAAIEPAKHGNAMCEIFGNYGWSEGVRLEKYLADHFMVRGVNHYVPHAFSAAPYPDPDCPPHFYAHGHNPQYRHFGALMSYMNRVCELISDGRHIAGAAVIYSAEGDWTADHSGKTEDYTNCDPVIRALYDAQIDCDVIPQDVFAYPEVFDMKIEGGTLKVNTQEYRMLLIPQTPYITKELAEAIPSLNAAGIPVYFAGSAPRGICDTAADADDSALLAAALSASSVLTPEQMRDAAIAAGLKTVQISPASNRIRCMHYVHADGTQILYLVNEAATVYEGVMTCPKAFAQANVYAYDAWANTVYAAPVDNGNISLSLEPYKSLLLVADPDGAVSIPDAPASDAGLRKAIAGGTDIGLSGAWKRSTCASASYPAFEGSKEVTLPDDLAAEQPLFSGFVRYENSFSASAGDRVLLEITDASEGVEVFINGTSLGIQIVPVYRYDLSGYIADGTNELRIEVATTLERERSKGRDKFGRKQTPTSSSGITGTVRLIRS